MPTKSYEEVKKAATQEFAEALKQGIDSEVDYTIKNAGSSGKGPEFERGYLCGLEQVKANFIDQIAELVLQEK